MFHQSVCMRAELSIFIVCAEMVAASIRAILCMRRGASASASYYTGFFFMAKI